MDVIEKRWTTYAEEHLKGRKIKHVRYMTKEETKAMGWYKRPLVMVLDNDTVLYLSMDDEGNDGGVMFGQTEEDELTFPVL